LNQAAKQSALLGKTDNELLGAVFLAAVVNQAASGAVIAPWDVEHLPDEWIEACRAATSGMAKWRKLLKDGGING